MEGPLPALNLTFSPYSGFFESGAIRAQMHLGPLPSTDYAVHGEDAIVRWIGLEEEDDPPLEVSATPSHPANLTAEAACPKVVEGDGDQRNVTPSFYCEQLLKQVSTTVHLYVLLLYKKCSLFLSY